jgi:hypothetical protein
VRRPGERADEPGCRQARRDGRNAERQRAPETVRQVVERDGARVELPALEPLAGAEEEREVGAEAEDDDGPPADGLARMDDDDQRDQPGRERRVRQAARPSRACSALSVGSDRADDRNGSTSSGRLVER